MENIALDTSVCIEIIKNKQRGISISEQISGNEIFLASVGLFELLLRRTNLEAVEELASRVNLLAFDEKAARKASDIANAAADSFVEWDLLEKTRRHGKPRNLSKPSFRMFRGNFSLWRTN